MFHSGFHTFFIAAADDPELIRFDGHVAISPPVRLAQGLRDLAQVGLHRRVQVDGARGRRADRDTLYDQNVVTFEADDVYNQADATGFIRLHALRLRSFGARRISEGE